MYFRQFTMVLVFCALNHYRNPSPHVLYFSSCFPKTFEIVGFFEFASFVASLAFYQINLIHAVLVILMLGAVFELM